MFAKCDLQNSLILQQIFYSVRAQIRTCTLQLKFDNSILIIPPKNKEVLNTLDTSRRRLQSEGAEMDGLFGLKNNYKRACKTTLSKLLLRSILRDWNYAVHD